MITDDERREMANELRRQAAYSSGSLGEWWQRLQEIVTGEIDFANPQETYRAIADLIDRPTCRIVHDENRDCDVCTNCSTSFELAEFDYADANVFEGYSYCPKCGAEVVEDD